MAAKGKLREGASDQAKVSEWKHCQSTRGSPQQWRPSIVCPALRASRWSCTSGTGRPSRMLWTIRQRRYLFSLSVVTTFIVSTKWLEDWQINYCTLYSTRVSPENTQKLMGFYMEGLVLGVRLHGFCFFRLFPIGCIGLSTTQSRLLAS